MLMKNINIFRFKGAPKNQTQSPYQANTLGIQKHPDHHMAGGKLI